MRTENDLALTTDCLEVYMGKEKSFTAWSARILSSLKPYTFQNVRLQWVISRILFSIDWLQSFPTLISNH